MATAVPFLNPPATACSIQSGQSLSTRSDGAKSPIAVIRFLDANWCVRRLA
jgi:hypothetical protein